jgi:hypothetical protein
MTPVSIFDSPIYIFEKRYVQLVKEMQIDVWGQHRI